MEDVSLELKFLGKKILPDGDYILFKNPGKFFVEYNDGEGLEMSVF